MKQALALAALSALVAACSATVQCDNYLNNSTYREALGRWIAVYTWPGQHSTDYEFGLTFNEPTAEDIPRHWNRSKFEHTLTSNPKLVAQSIYTGADILLDFSGDKITRVWRYYNMNGDMRTDEFKLRKIGDFLVMDFCEVGKDPCSSNNAWMMHRERSPSAESIAEAAACVHVPGTSGQEVLYSTE